MGNSVVIIQEQEGSQQGRRYEFEGGGSMHWKVGGGGDQYSKNTNI